MKLRNEYLIKLLVILLFLSPFFAAWANGEKIYFSKIYYVGLVLSFMSLIKFKEQVVNNWIFALTLLLIPINLVMISMYFF
jgi:hypothetical protein